MPLRNVQVWRNQMHCCQHDDTLSRKRVFGGGDSTDRSVKVIKPLIAIPNAVLVDWMTKELENGKLCARGTVVISGHSLSPTTSSIGTTASNNEAATSCVEVPKQVRDCSYRDGNYHEMLASNRLTSICLSSQLRSKYWDMIRNGQVCLVVSGGSTSNTVSSVVTKAAAEEADEYKCEIVSCKGPWGGVSSLIHHTEMSQAGVVIKTFHVESPNASVSPNTADATDTTTKHSSLTPEEEGQETVLAAEMVTLSVNSARKDE